MFYLRAFFHGRRLIPNWQNAGELGERVHSPANSCDFMLNPQRESVIKNRFGFRLGESLWKSGPVDGLAGRYGAVGYEALYGTKGPL